ncbi:WYL domain-containing protein [Maricaulis maris]|uniref:tellurite resistance TerB family protein n=3 Tax=Alphaproteobacteria TaxID=28211 RepID=UPI003A9181A1
MRNGTGRETVISPARQPEKVPRTASRGAGHTPPKEPARTREVKACGQAGEAGKAAVWEANEEDGRRSRGCAEITLAIQGEEEMLMTSGLEEVAEKLGARAESREIPEGARPARLSDEDDGESLTLDDAQAIADPDGIAEGQTFMIEYLDSKNVLTTRRITVLEITADKKGAPSLKARCHERNALRKFRVDRIVSCIDLDGEVHNHPVTFLNAALGTRLDPSIEPPDFDVAIDGDYTPPKPPENWAQINRMIVPHFSMLAALSRSDGKMRDKEVRVARDHCARLATEEGYPVSNLTLEWIEKSIRRRYPTRGYLKKTMNLMKNHWPPHHVTDLLMSGLELIDVDGTRDPEEIKLINEISQAVIGMDMA